MSEQTRKEINAWIETFKAPRRIFVCVRRGRIVQTVL